MREHLPCFFTEQPIDVGAVTLSDDAVHHARVRRLAEGDRVRLSNGAGRLGVGEIAKVDRKELVVRVELTEAAQRPAELHLFVPVADRDRMLWLAEKATELGVTSWTGVRFRRSASVSPRGEGEAFQAKVRARMIGALEQSNAAWLPRVEGTVDVGELAAPAGRAVVLDWGGDALIEASREEPAVRSVLVGPEGGIEPAELEALRAKGWELASLGDNMLRFETAALAAVAILRSGAHG